jgi:hypothetical protein
MMTLKTNTLASLSLADNFMLFLNNSNTPLARIGGDGGVGVNFFNLSDKRLKENIVPTRFGLDDLMKIRVCDYNLLDYKITQTGLIAQELYEVYPLAVGVGGDDPKTQPWGIDYGKLTPLLTKAVQDLNLKVENLEKDNQQLRDENAKLKAEMDIVKSYNARLEQLEIQLEKLTNALNENK